MLKLSVTAILAAALLLPEPLLKSQPVQSEAQSSEVSPDSKQPPLGITARAYVKRVIDGDTVELEIRLPVRVRLLDCWAPELRDAEGPESLAALLEKLPLGSKCVLHVPTKKARTVADVLTFGRVLGHVYRRGDNVGAAMVAEGFATKTKQE